MIANLVVNARSQLACVQPDAVNRANAAAAISLICFLNINANGSGGVETVTPFIAPFNFTRGL